MNRLLIALMLAGPATARTIVVAPGPDAQERLQTALIDAHPGDTVALGAGRFELTEGLSLDVAGVIVAGAGMDKTVLSFDGQKGEGEGLLVTSKDVTVRDFAVENARGNGIKAKAADGISFVRLRVVWTHGPKETNGAYGVYPVSSANVLIDGVTVSGASDAGIYVGQSRNIVVKNSRAEFNVAGIEIENSYNADVFDNVATKNAGGILVFDLPGLPQMGGHSVRLFRNKVVDNDTPNFAAKGNIVAGVPTGTGVMVMANRDVHVFDNDISGNGGNAVMVVSYRQAFTDKSYNPLPRAVVIGANKFGRNGFAPAFEGGKGLAAAVGGTLPNVMWDGVTDYVVPGGATISDADNLKINGNVLNLQLKTQGTPVAKAQPRIDTMTYTEGSQLAAIVLPAAQTARASAR